MRRLLKFLNLAAAQKRALLRAALVLAGIRCGLVFFRFLMLRKFFYKIRPVIGPPAEKLDETSIRRMVWAVETASRCLPGADNCLMRALALKNLLGREEGVGLRVGVAKAEDGQLRAHAWIERRKEILTGGQGCRAYAPLLNSFMNEMKEPR